MDLRRLQAEALLAAGDRLTDSAALQLRREEVGGGVMSRRAVFLNRVADELKPALRAMSERVEITRMQSTVGLTSDSAGFRGVELWGHAPTGKPVAMPKGQPVIGIILTDRGDLVMARYAYTESRDAVSWRATYELLTASDVVDYIAGEFDRVVDRIVQAAKRAAAESSPARAAELDIQIGRIKAAARLLGAR